MGRGRPKQEIRLSVEARQELEAIAGSRSLPFGLVRRAKIILFSASGWTDTAIAEEIGLSIRMVGRWRIRYLEHGLQGLYDEYRPGKPRTISDDDVASLLQKTMSSRPSTGTHWTCRALAKKTGVSKSTVQRVWSAFGLQPHRQKHFQLSNDPFFVEKVRDIVGLYLNPPDKALVLCVDEKSHIQALERTQPVLPMGLGYVEGVTHGYIRNGTTTLFAALDVATGQVIAQCKPRHRHQEFLQFLRHIEANVPPNLEIHLVVDNYATHKHKKVRLWLAERPRFHVHYTPTYSSWLNQVERWFRTITQRAIRRGSFRSVKELIRKIDAFVENYNQGTAPFVWTATADSIFQKLGRFCKLISGT